MSAWLSDMRTALNLFLPLVVSQPDRRPSSAGAARQRPATRSSAASGLPSALRSRCCRWASRASSSAAARCCTSGLERDRRVPRRHGIHARDAAARRVHLVRAVARGPQLAHSQRPVNEQEKSRRDLRAPAPLNPHPTTELEYSTPFELLVAVMLSAQATDVGVNKATRKLFPVANTPQAILDARRGRAEALHQRRSACTTPRRRT